MTRWAPPTGWIEVESALDGVRVWAPPPDDPREREAPEGGYRCASCGGTVGYDVACGDVACTFCGQVSSTDAAQVGRDAPEEAFTEERIAAASETWALDRRTLHCDGCGSDLAVEVGTLATSCPFCGSAQVLVREGVVRGLRPSALVPFKVDSTRLRARVREWLGGGWMHPTDLASGAVIDKFAGVYLPFWTFGARIDATWEAQVGTVKSKRVYRGGQWKTVSEVDWEWRSGRSHLDLQDRVQAGTSRVHAGLLRSVSLFDLRELVEYHPDLLAGWSAQAYDVGLEDAWDACRGHMRREARDYCMSDIGSSHVRNLSVSADFTDERWRYVLLPVHLCAYTWEDQVFHIVVNGQSGALAGQRPVVWWRVWAVVGAVFAPGLLLGLIGLPLLVFGVGAVVLAIAAVLLAVAVGVSIWILGNARDAENPS